jgi:hypothetical protein
MKMVIITAKHHDGFCLWPTKTTTHSVASSPWKNGQGDVIRELKEACEEYGMKFGIYLSPWDRNAACYGDSPAYNRFYMEQLTELLTWYGKVDEVWFDGANGEGADGRRQEYDWQAYYDLIRKLQPDAVTAIMGRGCPLGRHRERLRPRDGMERHCPGPRRQHPESVAINEALGGECHVRGSWQQQPAEQGRAHLLVSRRGGCLNQAGMVLARIGRHTCKGCCKAC